MADLTEHFKTTKHAIDSGEIVQESRPYLGMSQIGHPCERLLWYSFNWYYKDIIPKRISRLFLRGHREEEVVIDLLREAGIECGDFQVEFIDIEGHFKGHCDGTAINIPEAPKTKHILEIKTMNDANFKTLIKSGSVEKTKPEYYAQAQMYMHYGKLTRTLFIAVNKNTDELYAERIHYDSVHAAQLVLKAKSVILTESPPDRMAEKTYYMCRWCSAKTVCHYEGIPERNCRTCLFSEPSTDGTWLCEYQLTTNCIVDGVVIPLEIQRVGCTHYQRDEV